MLVGVLHLLGNIEDCGVVAGGSGCKLIRAHRLPLSNMIVVAHCASSPL
jgi:hypothetical protein